MSESSTPKDTPEQFFVPGMGQGIPILYSSVIQEAHSSNEFTLSFSQPIPVFFTGEAKKETTDASLLPVGVLKMSPQTAKDLCLLMNVAIRQYEEQYGAIITTYSQALAERGEG